MQTLIPSISAKLRFHRAGIMYNTQTIFYDSLYLPLQIKVLF